LRAGELLVNIGGKFLFNITILRVKGSVEKGRERNRGGREIVGIWVRGYGIGKAVELGGN